MSAKNIIASYNGRGVDEIYKINISVRDRVKIVLPEGEYARRLIYNDDKLRIINNINEVVVFSKDNKVKDYLSIITNKKNIYILKLVEKEKKGESDDIFIKNLYN
jgi:hypothetical protein